MYYGGYILHFNKIFEYKQQKISVYSSDRGQVTEGGMIFLYYLTDYKYYENPLQVFF